jgi:hypothetical protein
MTSSGRTALRSLRANRTIQLISDVSATIHDAQNGNRIHVRDDGIENQVIFDRKEMNTLTVPGF